MAKITEEDREQFALEADHYKKTIDESLEKEKNMLTVMKSDSVGVEYKKLILAEEMIYVATLYIQINGSSLKILHVKNNDALNDARKILYKAIIYLEEIVTNSINIAYSELADKMEAIQNTPVQKRYQLMQKLGLAIQMVIDGFGDNSKWKWSFVELQGRFAVVAKNLIDMKTAVKDYFDPNSPNYDATVLYIRLVRKLIDDSATAYRDRYELSTRRIDDINAGINFLLASRRIAVALGSSDDAEEIKKKAVTWKKLMEADQKAGKSN
ncbi:MAG: hypothetical protein J6Y36_00090 [Treponema sp.]|uniref:hypothetical protein n=1 Tax=Treponema sp. TaxID=166 RepID=UPI001B5C9E54|nr:hypothetical protein [Treponema sp.]MBP5401535.1 hypothetical protein [Treponema sp.]MBR5932919.1 hypothetical protein [Treponema sp.]